MTTLAKTPIHDWHIAHGARMVSFAGWSMPIQYQSGIMAEHRACRDSAALFDVSHMAQASLSGPDAVERFERLVPGDIAGLSPGRVRYTMLTTDTGGIVDDLMVSRTEDGLFLVFNAARRDADLAHLEAGLGDSVTLEPHPNSALIALQGPKAVEVVARHVENVERLRFMDSAILSLARAEVRISRLGYTGEDGVEIAVPMDRAMDVWELLASEAEVTPAGLGARDSLRLEAGLCLYGHDIDISTTPVEAGLGWTINKRRRNQGGFAGSDIILGQLQNGVSRRLVGLRPEGRAPVREGTSIEDAEGQTVGRVTSGGFGPSVNYPVAMGYVDSAHNAADTPVVFKVRGRSVDGLVVQTPFIKHRYQR